MAPSTVVRVDDPVDRLVGRDPFRPVGETERQQRLGTDDTAVALCEDHLDAVGVGVPLEAPPEPRLALRTPQTSSYSERKPGLSAGR
jgi:hypothetical protein